MNKIICLRGQSCAVFIGVGVQILVTTFALCHLSCTLYVYMFCSVSLVTLSVSCETVVGDPHLVRLLPTLISSQFCALSMSLSHHPAITPCISDTPEYIFLCISVFLCLIILHLHLVHAHGTDAHKASPWYIRYLVVFPCISVFLYFCISLSRHS